MESIATRLKRSREISGLTLSDVAERTGYALSTLGGVENGHDKPSKRLLQEWIAALQLNENWVKTGQGEVFREPSQRLMDSKKSDLGAPLRTRIRKVRQQASDLVNEIDQLERELLQSQTKSKSGKKG